MIQILVYMYLETQDLVHLAHYCDIRFVVYTIVALVYVIKLYMYTFSTFVIESLTRIVSQEWQLYRENGP